MNGRPPYGSAGRSWKFIASVDWIASDRSPSLIVNAAAPVTPPSELGTGVVGSMVLARQLDALSGWIGHGRWR
jgi:hypothetical protein